MSVRAFELVPVVERDVVVGEKARGVVIECVECCAKYLYVGTSDGVLHHFLLDEQTSPKGHLVYLAQKLQHKHLGLKKAVAMVASELKAASALERLIVLAEGGLYLHHMMSLELLPSASGKVKGVLSFCVNENPVSADPFCVELAVILARRRVVQIYALQEDRVTLLREVTTPQQPCGISLDGYFLCLALASQYVILNYKTSAAQDLFPFDSQERKPIIKRIGREEFLLAAPGGLGMFANAKGMSQRAPVKWSEGVLGAAVCFPYVVALDEGFVTVHSMLDQQLKQTFSFRDGRLLQDFEGKLLLASTSAVYMLVPLPLERQIQDLLASNRVDEALTLTEGARPNIPRDRYQVLHKRILQQAGFIHFGRLHFPEAKEHFRKGQLDVRELISLYPLLLPSSSSFTRCHPPLHPFADLHQLTAGDQDKVTRCKHFLISYLHEMRASPAHKTIATDNEAINGFREEVDTALLKLYAEADHHSLLDLLASDNACLLEDSAPWLEKYHKYFALGLLYQYNGQQGAALQLWRRVVDGELCDPTRADLYEYVVDFMSFCPDLDLVWKHADWALSRDQTIGVQIFTRRPPVEKEQNNKLNPDQVLTFLQKYTQALLLYLEHLVMDRNIQKEKFHTHLALLYTERVLGLVKQACGVEGGREGLQEARSKLQNLLKNSTLYRTQLLLGRLEGVEELHEERALLHGRLGEHEKALHILVHQLHDRPAAEAYCTWAASHAHNHHHTLNSAHDPHDSTPVPHVFHLLLATYLDPDVPGGADSVAAVDLLNRHANQFDAARVLALLPDGWSLQLIGPFLMAAVRKSAHAKRTSQLALALATGQYRQLLHDRIKQRGGPVVVSEKKGCHLCHNTFSEPECVCLPGGTPVHTHCAAQRLCDMPAHTHLENGGKPT